MISVHIQSLQSDASEALKDFARKRIDRLVCSGDTINKAGIALRLNKSDVARGKIAAIRLFVPGYSHYAGKGATTFEGAIDEAISALRRQTGRAEENE